MTAALRKEIEAALQPYKTGVIAVAVSGGSDSLALLYLMAEALRGTQTVLRGVTIDHGLRPAAAEEAHFVKSACDGLGIPHDTLVWSGWDGQGNTQHEARKARYGLIAEWARKHEIETVALGHTQDDQAETFLMRLSRESGVYGLSAMAPRRQFDGVTWVRPLLGVTRDALRDYLISHSVEWVDDPSNDDNRYQRIKTREQLGALGNLGIKTETLANVAKHMQSARDAIAQQTYTFAKGMVAFKAGALCIDWNKLSTIPTENRRVLLVSALKWLNGSSYPPRQTALDSAYASSMDTGAATLEGCLWRKKQNNLWLCRELNALGAKSVAPGALWDGRWRITGQRVIQAHRVKALGENGLANCPNWRDTSLPRDVLLSTPAVWMGDNLVAAPLVLPDFSWQAVLERGETDFFDAVISH